jgi:hypothetical protein
LGFFFLSGKIIRRHLWYLSQLLGCLGTNLQFDLQGANKNFKTLQPEFLLKKD